MSSLISLILAANRLLSKLVSGFGGLWIPNIEDLESSVVLNTLVDVSGWGCSRLRDTVKMETQPRHFACRKINHVITCGDQSTSTFQIAS